MTLEQAVLIPWVIFATVGAGFGIAAFLKLRRYERSVTKRASEALDEMIFHGGFTK